MLTYNDRTVNNACEIFEQCRDSKAEYWGIKEKPLPIEEMKALFARMRECGKKTVLEVVEYDEEECLNGAKTAFKCGCDCLMGTMFFESVNSFCREHNIKYLPFVGKVYNRPSVLDGSAEEMIADANSYIKSGACGIDLLGYRYTGDPVALNRKVVNGVNAPVCIAGSVNSYERLDEIKKLSPWAFTIGGAFFEYRFGDNFMEQIDKVCDYINS
jgi:hypothetical protein